MILACVLQLVHLVKPDTDRAITGKGQSHFNVMTCVVVTESVEPPKRRAFSYCYLFLSFFSLLSNPERRPSPKYGLDSLLTPISTILHVNYHQRGRSKGYWSGRGSNSPQKLRILCPSDSPLTDSRLTTHRLATHHSPTRDSRLATCDSARSAQAQVQTTANFPRSDAEIAAVWRAMDKARTRKHEAHYTGSSHFGGWSCPPPQTFTSPRF